MTDLASLLEKVAVDELAQIIRRVNGNHSLGAGELAEAILAALSPPIKAGEAVPVAIETLLDELERGVVSTGLHEDNETELFDIDEATEAMYQASVLIRVLCARTSPQPKAYGVKALEWEAYGGRWRASLPGITVLKYIVNHDKAGGYYVSVNGQPLTGKYPSSDGAKAVAQSHFAAAIFAAIDSPPDHDGGKRARAALQSDREGVTSDRS